jgi:hypothetical protein
MMVVELERDSPVANMRALFNCFLCDLKPHDGLSAKKTVERQPSILSTRQQTKPTVMSFEYGCSWPTTHVIETLSKP